MTLDDVYEWCRRSPYHLSVGAAIELVLGSPTSPGPIVARGEDVLRFPEMVRRARIAALGVPVPIA